MSWLEIGLGQDEESRLRYETKQPWFTFLRNVGCELNATESLPPTYFVSSGGSGLTPLQCADKAKEMYARLYTGGDLPTPAKLPLPPPPPTGPAPTATVPAPPPPHPSIYRPQTTPVVAPPLPPEKPMLGKKVPPPAAKKDITPWVIGAVAIKWLLF